MTSLFLPPLNDLSPYKNDNFFGIQTAYRAYTIEHSESKQETQLYVLTLAVQAEEHARIWKKLSETKQRQFCQLMPFTRPFSNKEGRGADGSQVIHFPDKVSFRVKNPLQQVNQYVEYDLVANDGRQLALVKTGSEGIAASLTPSLRNTLGAHFIIKADIEKHPLQMMQNWWNRAAWNALGFPVMMPQWISREGLWQVVPKRNRVTDFDSDAVARFINQLLAFQEYTSLSLTNLSWFDFRCHLAELEGQVTFYSTVYTPNFQEPPDWVGAIQRGNPQLFAKLKLPPTNPLKPHLAAFYQTGKMADFNVDTELLRLQILKRMLAALQEAKTLQAICSQRVMRNCFEDTHYFETLLGRLPDPRITDALPERFCAPVVLPTGQARLWDIALIMSARVKAGKMAEDQFQGYLADEVKKFVEINKKNWFNC